MNVDAYCGAAINMLNPGADGIANIDKAFKEEIEAFEETEDLIAQLKLRYGTNLASTTDLSTLPIEGDLNKLISYLGGLSGVNHGTNVAADGEYKHDSHVDVVLDGTLEQISDILALDRAVAGNVEKIKKLAKKALYETDTFTGTDDTYEKYYKEEIDKAVLFLSELKL
jgi:hypothetical protein